MFNLKDRVKVWCGEYKDKEGIIEALEYPPFGIGIAYATLKLDTNTIIKVDIRDIARCHKRR